MVNESALGLLVLRLADGGHRFTFDLGRVWLEFRNPAGGYRPAFEVRNPERFGPVPTSSARAGLVAGKAWVAEFERRASE